jgi:hypothetical protein
VFGAGVPFGWFLWFWPFFVGTMEGAMIRRLPPAVLPASIPADLIGV